tara:strand:+ start:405 stop:542 length:138 start_codon:yes stop_codon:yes gene_type:complete
MAHYAPIAASKIDKKRLKLLKTKYLLKKAIFSLPILRKIARENLA